MHDQGRRKPALLLPGSGKHATAAFVALSGTIRRLPAD
jgi:hypothetical protein